MKTLVEIANHIKNQREFTIASHVGPDGDSLGSTLALAHALKMLGKKTSIAFGDERVIIPPQYRFLEDLDWIVSYKKSKAYPNFIALECPQQSRLGGSYKLAKKANNLINIDHHADNKGYGTINYVNPDTSSTCEILFNLFKLLDIKLNKKISTFLYVGIVTDTGRFQYSNISPRTFHAAEDLLKNNVNPNEIFQHIYENRSLKSLKLLGMILSRAKVTPEGFIYSTITKEDFSLASLTLGETEDYIDFLRSTQGVKVAAILKERANGEVKVSLRSRNAVSVARVAEKFGGGGHEAAAGYTSTDSLDDSVKNLCRVIKQIL